MHIDGFEQLSAVSGLSRERDGVSLTRVLIHTLRALSPGIDVTVWEVFGHRRMAIPGVGAGDVSVRRFDETGQRPARRERVAGVADAVARARPVAIDGGADGTRLVVPLSGDIGPLRLVVLDAIPGDPGVRARLTQVVEIYGNLVRLMDSRERDALTGLLNRQMYAPLFEQAVEGNAGDNPVLTVAVLDIDHFKKVNDAFGHLYGDEVLIHFARLMERSFRCTDDLFRFEGEAFVVLLAGAGERAARVALERFRRRVADYEFPGVRRVTVSAGFVTCRAGQLPTTLIDRADRALRAAKDAGRNRVIGVADVDAGEAAGSGSVQLF